MSRYGRPGSKAAALRQACHERLLEHEREGSDGLPTSNRFLLYELRQAGWPDALRTRAEGRGFDQDVADASKWLRDAGIVPWDWIVDETRTVTSYVYADTGNGYLLERLSSLRLNCWGPGRLPPLVLCESRTFGGVMGRTVAAEYLCPVASTNGQVGGFLRTDIAPLLRGNDRSVRYVGDLELAGAQIEENTRAVLERATGRELDWERLALTEAQAVGLPRIIKRTAATGRPADTKPSRSRPSGSARSPGSCVPPSKPCCPHP
jgi:hypothetical protein